MTKQEARYFLNEEVEKYLYGCFANLPFEQPSELFGGFNEWIYKKYFDPPSQESHLEFAGDPSLAELADDLGL
jgi:hypothetical protein